MLLEMRWQDARLADFSVRKAVDVFEEMGRDLSLLYGTM
jgi:hypothetical protein